MYIYSTLNWSKHIKPPGEHLLWVCPHSHTLADHHFPHTVTGTIHSTHSGHTPFTTQLVQCLQTFRISGGVRLVVPYQLDLKGRGI